MSFRVVSKDSLTDTLIQTTMETKKHNEKQNRGGKVASTVAPRMNVDPFCYVPDKAGTIDTQVSHQTGKSRIWMTSWFHGGHRRVT